MKTSKIFFAAIFALVLSSFTAFELVNWKVKDENYAVTFSGKRVDGGFKGLKASIMFDETNPTQSKISASIDVNTINTGNGLRDKHAKSESALDAEKYPNITFVSSSVAKSAAGYEAKGKLTIKGISKDIVLPFVYESKGAESVFKGHFTLIPADYNITKMGTPDKIDVDLNIPVVK